MELNSTRVIWLDPADPNWARLVREHPQANIFHHPAWLAVLQNSYSFEPRLVGMIDLSGNILAGLPVMVVKNIYQRKKWVSLPFSDHCSPLCLQGELADRLLTGLVDFGECERIPTVEIRCDMDPSIGAKWIRSDAFVLSRVRLAPDENEVAKRIKPKHFRQIKVAYDRGVRVEMGDGIEYMQEFYKLHVQTRQRKGLPVQPWRFFQEIVHSITQPGLGYILLAYSTATDSTNGQVDPVPKCVAGAVFFHWNQTLTYKYAASSEEARQLLAMDAILWKAIQWGCENHYEWLDMGRTDVNDQGLRSFKRRWGAEEVPLNYAVLRDGVRKKEHGKSSQWLHGFVRHSPLWVCRVTGELLYKYYG